MQPSPSAKAYEAYRTSIVPDAGAAHLPHQPHGNPGMVYPCPSHSGASCGLCGGSGYRAVATLQPVTNMDARTAHAAGRRPTTLQLAILKEKALTDD